MGARGQCLRSGDAEGHHLRCSLARLDWALSLYSLSPGTAILRLKRLFVASSRIGPDSGEQKGTGSDREVRGAQCAIRGRDAPQIS